MRRLALSLALLGLAACASGGGPPAPRGEWFPLNPGQWAASGADLRAPEARR